MRAEGENRRKKDIKYIYKKNNCYCIYNHVNDYWINNLYNFL